MAKTVSMKIGRDAWDKLSQIEKEAMSKLGYSPKKKTVSIPRPRRYTKSRELKEYILCMVINCSLCKGRTYEFYHMQETKEGLQGEFAYHQETHWEHTRIDPPAEKKADKLEGVTRMFCVKCPEVLKKWKHEDLVTELLRLARAMQCDWGRS